MEDACSTTKPFGTAGLEPATSGLTGSPAQGPVTSKLQRSTIELCSDKIPCLVVTDIFYFGEVCNKGGGRGPDYDIYNDL